MRTFAQKQDHPSRSNAATAARRSGGLAPNRDDVQAVLHVQRTEEDSDAALPSTESRYGHDFSRIAVFPPVPRTLQATRRVSEPGDAAELEADRVAAQVMRRPEGGTPLVSQSAPPGTILRQTDATDTPATDRYKQIHKNLFIDKPGTGSGALKPWASSKKKKIIKQAKKSLKKDVNSNPLLVIDDLPIRSTEKEADKEAVDVDKRIRERFPYITKTFTEKQLKDAVTVDPEGKLMSSKFVHDWVANKLPDYSDVEEYDLRPGSTDHEDIIKRLQTDTKAFNFSTVRKKYLEMLVKAKLDTAEIFTRIEKAEKALDGKSWGWVWKKRASRVSAYHEKTVGGGGTSRNIFINPYKDDASRLLTLIHEFMHFYTHDNFDKWVDKTTNPDFYEEGFTEFLARQVMTTDEQSGRASYQDRFVAVRDEVAAHVSVEDIAMAYLQGEVWRLEGTSEVAKTLFKDQVGLDLDAERGDEVDQSETAKGIVQTVTSGGHYRFMNLAVGGAAPKPEHRSAFERMYNEHVKDKPGVTIRFVGHTSTTGSKWFNEQLSKKRAAAFYQMAKDVGVPSSQLTDATSPQGKGFEDLNVDDSDVYGRAFNRRVEMFIETV